MNTRRIMLVGLITAVAAVCASASAFAAPKKLICNGTGRDHGYVVYSGNWLFVIDDSDNSVIAPNELGYQLTVTNYDENRLTLTLVDPNSWEADFTIDRVTGGFTEIFNHSIFYTGTCSLAKQKF